MNAPMGMFPLLNNPTVSQGMQSFGNTMPFGGVGGIPDSSSLAALSAFGNQGSTAIGANVMGAPASPSAWDGFKGWMGKQNLGDIAQGLGALGGIWQSRQMQGLARDNLNFQREAFNTNLNNSIQSYNTNLEDRIRGRTANPNEADVRSYLDQHSLRRG